MIPFNEHAAASIEEYPSYRGPSSGFTEQVYCITPLAGRDGRTTIGLVNRARNKGISMSFAVEQLPYVTLWKNTNSEGEGYVTGLEPGTNYPNNRRIERKFGRVPKLKSGESHHAVLDFTILSGRQAVNKLVDQVQRLQQQAQPLLQKTPENKD